jgi:O-antigen ligase
MKRKILNIFGSACIFFLFLFIINESPRLKYRFIQALEKNLNARMVSWAGSVEIFKAFPLFGVGTGANQKHLNQYYVTNTQNPQKYLEFNSHNYLLHVMMTFGIVGFLVILIFWISILVNAAQSQNDLLIKFLILFLLCQITEVMTVTQKGTVFFYAFYSLNVMFSIGENRSVRS